jgi:hypothetical protein
LGAAGLASACLSGEQQFVPEMKLNRTDLRNLAMVELAVAAPQLFIRKQGKSTKVAFMDYQTAIPFKGKRPGTSFVLLPNVRSGRAVYATSGKSKPRPSKK